MAQKTASSSYGSSFVRGSHRFHIVGYSERKALAGVVAGNSSSVRSGDFEIGGHTWALSCRFGKRGLASISLNLVSIKPAAAMASLRIDDPRRRWPAAVWRSDVPNASPSDGLAATGQGWRWELSLPETFSGHEERYVEDDHLAILCVVDVLDPRAVRALTSCFISPVPPPTLSRDLLGLILPPPKSKPPPESVQRHRRPDVTFIVEGIEIHAHKILVAMESPVFAAQFRWHSDESNIIIRVDDMTASTFRAMLRYCYTGELPIKPRRNNATLTCHYSDKEKCALRRYVSMALDLLVAADRYDLERLRTLCGNILVECMDAVSIVPIFMVVHGRQSFQQLEDSCIEYIASHPDVYTAMKETEDYKDPKEEGCCSLLLQEITDKVAIMNMAPNMRSSPFTSKSSSIKSTPSSNNNLPKGVQGTHEFTIPNFRAVQRSIIGADTMISSETFQIGGYAWKIWVQLISKQSSSSALPEAEQEEEPITVFLQLSSDLTSMHVRTSMSFKMDYPSATPPMIEQVTRTFAEKFDCTYTEFRVMKSAKYAQQDDSLTIHCQLMVSKEAYASSGTTIIGGVGEEMLMPSSSNIASHLERLLVSKQGSDLSFLVEGCDFHAHGLVIAARSPALYEMVAAAAAANNKDRHIVHVDHMKATVFRSVLHFIYTDKMLPSIDDLPAQDMLTAACRFGLERMKIMCENVLAEYISKENALNTLKLAQHHHCLKLENYCLEFMAN